MTEQSAHIVVVDDDDDIRSSLAKYLRKHGFRVSVAANGDELNQVLSTANADLLVLDIMLPGDDGLTICRRVLETRRLPIIFLTALAEDIDRILGLELGADDYVVKPFSPRELAARVRAILKRSSVDPRTSDGFVDVGEFRIDPLTREAWVSGTPLDLKPREFDLLLFMANHPRQVFSRGQLLEQVWESSSGWQDPSTVTVHVRRVRLAIEANPDIPRYLTTVWGVGYRFEP